jgi:hypothetical protein
VTVSDTDLASARASPTGVEESLAAAPTWTPMCTEAPTGRTSPRRHPHRDACGR